VCQSNETGRWIGPQCDACELFFWGSQCTQICSCNEHGGCDKNTGDCECFGDDDHGHWSGDDCSACAKGFIGIDCRGLNVEMNANTNSSGQASVQNKDMRSILLVDNEFGVTYTGSRPLILLNTTSHPRQPVTGLEGGVDFNGWALEGGHWTHATTVRVWEVTLGLDVPSVRLATARQDFSALY